MKLPERDEYAPYYHTYISKLPEGDICEILEQQIAESLALLSGISETRSFFRYAPEKWSIKEVMGHVVDMERVFAFRAMMFARNDPGPFPSAEQDQMIRHANFDSRTLADICEEFRLLRAANLHLFRSFDEETGQRRGIASGYEFTVRALPAIIAGHERHHMGVLRERYLT